MNEGDEIYSFNIKPFQPVSPSPMPGGWKRFRPRPVARPLRPAASTAPSKGCGSTLTAKEVWNLPDGVTAFFRFPH